MRWEIRLTAGFIGLFILSVLLAHQLHELGHYAVARLQGADIVFETFDRWEVLSPVANPLPILVAGNLVNLFLAYSGLTLVFRSKRFKDLGFCLAFSSAMFIVGNSVAGLAGARVGDEKSIAAFLGVDPKIVYTFFLLVFLPPLIFAFQILEGRAKQKFLKFTMLLALLSGTLAPVILIGEFKHLAPGLFSLVGGLPVAMILLNALILSLLVFFAISRLKRAG
jgi:hypothetical protein